MMSDSHHTYIFCFWQCPLTHAIVYANWGIILWTSCFHYDSCLCLQTTHFNTTHYSKLHDSRMQGKERSDPLTSQIRAHGSDMMVIAMGFPSQRSDPHQYPICSSIMGLPSHLLPMGRWWSLGHRELSAALREWLGVVIPVTKICLQAGWL